MIGKLWCDFVTCRSSILPHALVSVRPGHRDTRTACGKRHNRHLLLEGCSLQLCPVQLAMHALHVSGEVLERLVSLFSARV